MKYVRFFGFYAINLLTLPFYFILILLIQMCGAFFQAVATSVDGVKENHRYFRARWKQIRN